jgi:hypothetical protein
MVAFWEETHTQNTRAQAQRQKALHTDTHTGYTEIGASGWGRTVERHTGARMEDLMSRARTFTRRVLISNPCARRQLDGSHGTRGIFKGLQTGSHFINVPMRRGRLLVQASGHWHRPREG